MDSPRDLTFRSLGLELRCAAWGDPAAPAVVLLHGFQDHGRSWDRVARILAARYHVLCPDQRGFGQSGWVGAGGSYHFYDYFMDLDALLGAAGLARAHLVGHSMGANVAAGFAGAFPERVGRVALIEGLGMPDNAPEDAPLRIRRWIAGTRKHEERQGRPLASLQEAAARLRQGNSALSEEAALGLAAHGTRPHPSGGLAWSFDPLHRAPSAKPFYLSEWRAFWRRVPGPVLVVAGGRSPFRLPDVDARLAELDRPVVEVLPDAGHNVHHDAADALAALLLRHLDGAEEDSR